MNDSLERYFELDNEFSPVKYEYFAGDIFAMSGGTPGHTQIARRLVAALSALESSGCEAYYDLRTAAPSGLYTYPDAMVICGEPLLAPGRTDTVTNPIVIGEVLSDSTANYDRGRKFELYTSIETFRDYLLVDQNRIGVEHRWREADGWRSKRYTQRDDQVPLTGIPLTLRVGDLYPVTIPA